MEGSARDELVRKWEDLNRDCLSNIIERVGMESLVSSFPYVCKNWYNASLDPQCWKFLDIKSLFDSECHERFPRGPFSPPPHQLVCFQKLPLLELLKFAVARNQGNATTVVLPDIKINFEEAITYISNTCPMLKTLVLPRSGRVADGCISKLVRKWTYLEGLTLNCQMHFHDIISEINTHCKNFASLTTWGFITEEATTAIVTLLPNIKCLNLRESILHREKLVRILSKCKKLEFLDVSFCEGFDFDDAEIIQLASHIGIFLAEGSFDDRFDYDYDYHSDYCNSSESLWLNFE